MTMVKIRDLSIDEIAKSQPAGYQKKPHQLGFIRTTRIDGERDSWHGTVGRDGKIIIK